MPSYRRRRAAKTGTRVNRFSVAAYTHVRRFRWGGTRTAAHRTRMIKLHTMPAFKSPCHEVTAFGSSRAKRSRNKLISS